MSAAPEAKVREWRAHPQIFVRGVLQAEPDEWQDEVLKAVVTNDRLALKASKGPGKSTLLAWIGWWFLFCHLHPKVVATSISGDNLADGLWAEIAKWQLNSRLLRATFTWTASRVFAKQHSETWWASARSWPKGADTSAQADTLAGVHADNVLFLIDEAGGIPDAVVATAEAGLANADAAAGRVAKLILAGNPTHLEGPLYRACTRERALWWVKEISGDPDDPKRAPRVSLEWARQQISKYGRDNPWVLVNVFGQFPPGQSNCLIGVEDASKAGARTLKDAEWVDEVRILGVDVARFGDDRTVLFPRQGKVALRPKVFRGLDTMTVASHVASLIEKWNPAATFVDVATFGAGVVDRLHQLGFPVIGVDFGGKALQPKFSNRRSEMWHGMADWLRAGGCTPDIPELVAELTAPTYKFDPAGKLLLEKKAEVKKRVGVSPDLADALCLTFAQPVAHPGLKLYRGRTPQHALTEYDPYQQSSGPAQTEYDPFERS